MVSNPRGQCLIINNEKFKHSDLPDRKGSQVDVDKLKMVFSTLGFEVKIQENLNKAAMEKELELFATQTDNLDMIIMIVLSHGENGKIQCQDYCPPLNKNSDVAVDGEASTYYCQLFCIRISIL